MNATETIAKVRELCEKATAGPWEHYVTDDASGIIDHSVGKSMVQGICCGISEPSDAEFIAQSRTLIPALCDALESLQSTLEQSWEWDMYQAAKREIERLRKELEAAQKEKDRLVKEVSALARESVEREKKLARLEAEVSAAIEGMGAQKWNDGAPPDFGADDIVWIIAEIPSLFLPGQLSYKAVCWFGGWCDKTVLRATRWMIMAMPAPPKGAK